MFRLKFVRVTVLLSLLLVSTITSADEEAMESLIVTGSYAPEARLTASSTVLNAQQIQALNKKTLGQVLKTIPGLLVEEQGGAGGLTAVSIRGGEANFTLVKVDGVTINDSTNSRGGGFDFSNFNSFMVERIEVVRGAQSAIYGSDALAGVINIITRQPEAGHHQVVNAEWGQDDFHTVSLAALGKVDTIAYTVELTSTDDGEPTPGSTRQSDSANASVIWTPVKGQEFRLGVRYFDSERMSYPEQSGGPIFAVRDDLDTADYNDQIASFDWISQVSPNWRSQFSASHFYHEEDYVSPGIPEYLEVPPNASDTEFTRDHLRWVNTFKVANGYEINLGADFLDEDGDSTGYVEFFGDRIPTDFELDRSTAGLFTSISARLTPKLMIQSSIRYDDPEGFESETSFHAGILLDVTNELSISGNWGNAYKLPSFFALGHALVGNPDLLPEQAESWDVGLQWNPSAALMTSATYFSNDYENLVDFDDATFRNVNRQQVLTSGVELQVTWSPSSNLSVSAQSTYTDIEVKGEDTVLTGRPELVAGLWANWQLTQQWGVVLDYRYSGEQWAASRHTGNEVTEKLPSYNRLDWVVRFQPNENWQLQFSVDNLLDEDYVTAVGFNAPGALYRIGATLQY
jgi:vitamin B12 transporter